MGAKALAEQVIPATINCDQPLDSLQAEAAPARSASLHHVLVMASSYGGQNVAIVLRKV